jgi:hypothetical protein
MGSRSKKPQAKPQQYNRHRAQPPSALLYLRRENPSKPPNRIHQASILPLAILTITTNSTSTFPFQGVPIQTGIANDLYTIFIAVAPPQVVRFDSTSPATWPAMLAGRVAAPIFF